MTSSEQLDDLPRMSSLLFDNTKDVRGSLIRQPLLEAYIRYTQVVASSLNEYFAFLYEDSESADPKLVRDYMIQEMLQLRRMRKWLNRDLRGFFTDQQIITVLSRVNNRSEVIDSCIDELDSIRIAVKRTLGDAIEAALDDLSNEHLSPVQRGSPTVTLQSLSAQRRDSRMVALESLQSLAQKWDTLSKQLSSAKEIVDQRGSA